MGLSPESFELAKAVTPKISAAVSMLGSTLIVRDIYRKYKRRRGLSTTNQVILSMSLADIGSSFWAHLLSTWMVPRGSEGATLTAGNMATCSTQAFFYELFLYSGTWSTALLALTYWLIICREKRESTLKKWKYQLPLLGSPWFFGLLNATPKIAMGHDAASFNGYWWCELFEGHEQWDNRLDQIFSLVCFIIILFSMACLARSVYLQERRNSLYRFDTSHQREKFKQVTYQGIFYISVWLFIVIPTVMVTILEEKLSDGFFIFWAIIFPMQGLANSFIYFRPEFVAIRSKTELTRRSTILRVLHVSSEDQLQLHSHSGSDGGTPPQYPSSEGGSSGSNAIAKAFRAMIHRFSNSSHDQNLPSDERKTNDQDLSSDDLNAVGTQMSSSRKSELLGSEAFLESASGGETDLSGNTTEKDIESSSEGRPNNNQEEESAESTAMAP